LPVRREDAGQQEIAGQQGARRPAGTSPVRMEKAGQQGGRQPPGSWTVRKGRSPATREEAAEGEPAPVRVSGCQRPGSGRPATDRGGLNRTTGKGADGKKTGEEDLETRRTGAAHLRELAGGPDLEGWTEDGGRLGLDSETLGGALHSPVHSCWGRGARRGALDLGGWAPGGGNGPGSFVQWQLRVIFYQLYGEVYFLVG
jgi:hypothetical protein